jgi:hypothetical protein
VGDVRHNAGALGTAAELLGGGVAGGGLALSGVTAARLLSAPSLVGRTAATAADAAGLGGFSAAEGNGLFERAPNTSQGALIGALIDGALPSESYIFCRNQSLSYACCARGFVNDQLSLLI